MSDVEEDRERMRARSRAMATVADAAAARDGSLCYGEAGWIEIVQMARREAEEARLLYRRAGVNPLGGDPGGEPEGEDPFGHVFTTAADMRRSYTSISPVWDRRRQRMVSFVGSGERADLERALGLDPGFERSYEAWRANPDADPGDGLRESLEREGGWEAVEHRYKEVLREAYESRLEEHDRLAIRTGCALADGWGRATDERAATLVGTATALQMARAVAHLMRDAPSARL